MLTLRLASSTLLAVSSVACGLWLMSVKMVVTLGLARASWYPRVRDAEPLFGKTSQSQISHHFFSFPHPWYRFFLLALSREPVHSSPFHGTAMHTQAPRLHEATLAAGTSHNALCRALGGSFWILCSAQHCMLHIQCSFFKVECGLAEMHRPRCSIGLVTFDHCRLLFVVVHSLRWLIGTLRFLNLHSIDVADRVVLFTLSMS